jgi:hypothetical protein
MDKNIDLRQLLALTSEAGMTIKFTPAHAHMGGAAGYDTTPCGCMGKPDEKGRKPKSATEKETMSAGLASLARMLGLDD